MSNVYLVKSGNGEPIGKITINQVNGVAQAYFVPDVPLSLHKSFFGSFPPSAPVEFVVSSLLTDAGLLANSFSYELLGQQNNCYI